MSHREWYEELWAGDYSVDEWVKGKALLCKSLIPDDVETLLDAGCGDGTSLRILGKHYSAVGIDLSLSAMRRCPVAGVVGQLEALPFRDASFDLVICSEVLEHIDGEDSLRRIGGEMVRVAKRYVLISAPDREVLEKRHVRCPHCYAVSHAYRHFNSLSKEEIARLFPGCQLMRALAYGQLDGFSARFLYLIQQRIGNKWWRVDGNSPFPRCRCCGQVLHPGAANLLGLAMRALNRVIERVRRKPYWQIVLLEKSPLPRRVRPASPFLSPG